MFGNDRDLWRNYLFEIIIMIIVHMEGASHLVVFYRFHRARADLAN